MKKLLFTLFFCAIFMHSYAGESKWVQSIRAATSNTEYILCIDGGGSKTTLHVIDSQGSIQNLTLKGQSVQMIKGTSGNINFIEKESLEGTFHQLFDELEINGVPISKICTKCAIVAGMAGLGSDKNQEIVCDLLANFGFSKENIVALSDAELALEVVGEKGIVLIAGTGSIAFGRDESGTKRAGGFGSVLGDNESGYNIGKLAITAALDHEKGYGVPTVLTDGIKAHFGVTRVYEIVTPICSSNINNEQIAFLSRLVFHAARQGDPIANKIIAKTAKNSGVLLKNLLILLRDETDYDVYLVGGVFLDKSASEFIHMVENTEALKVYLQGSKQEIQFHNIANLPIAVMAMQAILERLQK